MKSIFYSVALLLVLLCGCTSKTEVSSPDGNIKWSLNLDEKGAMSYQVVVNNQSFILPSALGF